MNEYVVVLSQENISLAKAEFFARFPAACIHKENNERLILSGNISPEPLALTRKIYQNNHCIFTNNEQWHLRRMNGSVGLSPKLARAMVNLTGVSRDMPLVDPFCGSGGILREAALLGHPVVGYDTKQETLSRAQQNVPSGTFFCQDACDMKEKLFAVVTDVPYGKNTSVPHLISLYTHFLSTVYPLLQKTMVICFPHFVSGKALLEHAGFHILEQYRWRLHHGLTKEIFVTTTSPTSAFHPKLTGTSKISDAVYCGT